MGKVMQLFTVGPESVEFGTVVGTLSEAGGNKVPAILIGISRIEIGVVRVELTPEQHEEWSSVGYVTIKKAKPFIGKGKGLTLIAANETTEHDNSKAVVIIRADNAISCSEQTGDLLEFPKHYMLKTESLEKVTKQLQSTLGIKRLGASPDDTLLLVEASYFKKTYGLEDSDFLPAAYFLDFPGKVLLSTGEGGCVEEMVAEIPLNNIFRVCFHDPDETDDIEMYYVWDGEKILNATWEQRGMYQQF